MKRSNAGRILGGTEVTALIDGDSRFVRNASGVAQTNCLPTHAILVQSDVLIQFDKFALRRIATVNVIFPVTHSYREAIDCLCSGNCRDSYHLLRLQ